MFNFVNIFEMQSEFLEGFGRVDFEICARGKNLGLIAIGEGNEDVFDGGILGVFEQVDDAFDGAYFAV